MRTPTAAAAACVLLLAGCASPGTIDQSLLKNESRQVIQAINRSMERVERSELTEAEKETARTMIRTLTEGQFATDLLAARLAGSKLSQAEAQEVQASLSLIYRNLEGVAGRPPATLARDGASLSPESERLLRDLERLLR